MIVKQPGLICSLLLSLLCFTGCGAGKSADQTKMTSKKVTVAGNVAYEVALPDKIAKGKTYPLFFFLSPDGDPKKFLPSAGPACEELKCIFAGSYNYRNNTHPDTWANAIKDCIAHISKTQPVDKTRIFLGGFSGGAQASYVTSFFNQGICQGILANSGVIHQNLRDPGELRQTRLKAVALLSGTTDNVVTPDHLRQDERLLQNTGIANTFISFKGGHEIAPKAQYLQAMKWLLKQ